MSADILKTFAAILVLAAIASSSAGCEPAGNGVATPTDSGRDRISEVPREISMMPEGRDFKKQKYGESTFLAAVPIPPQPVFRKLTEEEKQRIVELRQVLTYVDPKKWAENREKIRRIGNGAMEIWVHYVLNMWALSKVSAMGRKEIWEISMRELIECGEDAVSRLLHAFESDQINDMHVPYFRDIFHGIGKPALPYLFVAIRDATNPIFRARLAEVLSYFPEENVVMALEDVASVDTYDDARIRALTSLGELKFLSSTKAIRNVMTTDENWFVRRAAAVALGRFKVPEAVGALVVGYRDKVAEVRGQISVSLAAIMKTALMNVNRPIEIEGDKFARVIARMIINRLMEVEGVGLAVAALKQASVEALRYKSGAVMQLSLIDEMKLHKSFLSMLTTESLSTVEQWEAWYREMHANGVW